VTHKLQLALWTLLLLVPTPGQGAEDMGRWTFYFGELHAHTGLSNDGASEDLGSCPNADCGNFEDYFDIARAQAGLDFCSITDHVNGIGGLDQSSWAETVELVNDHNDPVGGFVTILGGEMALGTIGAGHKNVYFFGNEAVLNTINYWDVMGIGHPGDCEQLWTDMADLEAGFGEVLLLSHHPAAVVPVATDWSCHDETYSPAVEIYSSHGNSRDDPAQEPYDTLTGGVEPGCTVNDALDPQGYALRLGIIGGTDFHDTQPGMVCHMDQIHANQRYGGSLTGLFVDTGVALDRGQIYDAISKRRTYATTGPKVPVMIRLLDSGGDELAVMGDWFGPMPADPMTVEVTFPDTFAPYVDSVDLYQSDGSTLTVPHIADGHHEVALNPAGEWFVYAIVSIDGGAYWADQGVACEDGGADAGERIWTSPIWIRELDVQDDDGDGWSEDDGDCDDTDVTATPADADGDGVSSCDGDCDDGDAAMNPLDLDGDGSSTCAGDCDDTDAARNNRDDDGDGYDTCGGPGMEADCDDSQACLNPYDEDRDGASTCQGDCNDSDAAVDPWDLDGDGLSSCDGDCDDGDGAVHPGAVELACDGQDNDCDGKLHELDGDADGDGHTGCDGDCDDADPWLTPADGDGDGASTCGGDCDDGDGGLNIRDDDGDGYDTCGGPYGEVDCDDADPCLTPVDSDQDGLSSCGGDCDDGDAEMNTLDLDGDGFTTCAGDCDDHDDEWNPADLDGDGVSRCAGDCDDGDASIHPGAEEIACNLRDDDCDGRLHENDLDDDRDGYSECGGDCDDGTARVHPGAAETPNGIDDDCDGAVDEGPGTSRSSTGGCGMVPSSEGYPPCGTAVLVALTTLAAMTGRRRLRTR